MAEETRRDEAREDDIPDDEALRSFLGTSSFGKQAKTANIAAQINRSKREPAVAVGAEPQESLERFEASAGSEGDDDNQASDDEDGDDDDDDEDEEDEFPVSHELVIKTHERAITTATLDPSGTRLITGSTDCTLKFHDFASMTPNTIRAFKSVDPSAAKGSANVETHP
ncbi:hypothetical protein LTR39_003536, partial [Cryomyces antarcticus]